MNENINNESLSDDKDLLNIIKQFLNITWDDEVTDNELLLHIKNGTSDIDYKTGKKFDYTTPGKHQELLSNYVMYARSGALSDFYNNYQSELLALQLKTRIENNETGE